MGDGPTLLLPATCGFARSDPEVCSGYQQAPFDPSPLDHVSYCCPAPRSPTLTKIIHPTRLNGWCRLMCGLRSLLPAKKRPNSSSNTPSSTRISSPPKCAWLWKNVSGCQRTSAVCSPACSCKGITVSPGTRPGSHRIRHGRSGGGAAGYGVDAMAARPGAGADGDALARACRRAYGAGALAAGDVFPEPCAFRRRGNPRARRRVQGRVRPLSGRQVAAQPSHEPAPAVLPRGVHNLRQEQTTRGGAAIGDMIQGAWVERGLLKTRTDLGVRSCLFFFF